MNVELLKKVREAIADETNPVGFNMGTYGARTSCGTTACIAGHAVMIAAKNRWKWDSGQIWPRAAGLTMGELGEEVLQIGEQAAFYLFSGRWSHRYQEITREETLAYLDKCIAAKKVVR
jgi:hypothetical protein